MVGGSGRPLAPDADVHLTGSATHGTPLDTGSGGRCLHFFFSSQTEKKGNSHSELSRILLTVVQFKLPLNGAKMLHPFKSSTNFSRFKRSIQQQTVVQISGHGSYVDLLFPTIYNS